MPHKDPEAFRAYQKAYREATRAKRAARRPDDDRARHANERAEKYGAPGRIGIREVRIVMAAGECHYCGSSDRLTLDHVTPLHAGGANALSNLVACCLSCNISKFRSDRPRRWSRTVDACIKCSTTDLKHVAFGMCGPCYRRTPEPSRVVPTEPEMA